PTLVTVWIAHHMPLPSVGNSCLSTTWINAPLTSVVSCVVAAMARTAPQGDSERTGTSRTCNREAAVASAKSPCSDGRGDRRGGARVEPQARKLRSRGDTELREYAPQVRVDRARGEEELRGDLLVRETLRHVAGDLKLLWRQLRHGARIALSGGF